MTDPATRRVCRGPPIIPLVVIAVYSTLGALALVHDRGDDFRRFYASAAEWAHGNNPYTVVINDTPNLNHPILLPLSCGCSP